MAIASFPGVDCSGLARVDFLMEPQDRARSIVNEINTMPGLHLHQHVSQAVAASGIKYSGV